MGRDNQVRGELNFSTNLAELVAMVESLGKALRDALDTRSDSAPIARGFQEALQIATKLEERFKGVRQELSSGQQILTKQVKELESAITMTRREAQTMAAQLGKNKDFIESYRKLLDSQGMKLRSGDLTKAIQGVGGPANSTAELKRQEMLAKAIGDVNKNFADGYNMLVQYRTNLHTVSSEVRGIDSNMSNLSKTIKTVGSSLSVLKQETTEVFGVMESQSTKAVSAIGRAARTHIDQVKNDVNAMLEQVKRGATIAPAELQTTAATIKRELAELERIRKTGRDLSGATRRADNGMIDWDKANVGSMPVMTPGQARQMDQTIQQYNRFLRDMETKFVPRLQDTLNQRRLGDERRLHQQQSWGNIQRADEMLTGWRKAQMTGDFTGVGGNFMNEFQGQLNAIRSNAVGLETRRQELLSSGNTVESQKLQETIQALRSRVASYEQVIFGHENTMARSQSIADGYGGYRYSATRNLYSTGQNLRLLKNQISLDHSGSTTSESLPELLAGLSSLQSGIGTAEKRLKRKNLSESEREELQKSLTDSRKLYDQMLFEYQRYQIEETKILERNSKNRRREVEEEVRHERNQRKQAYQDAALNMIGNLAADPSMIKGLSRHEVPLYRRALNEVGSMMAAGGATPLTRETFDQFQRVLREREAEVSGPTMWQRLGASVGMKVPGAGGGSPYGNDRMNMFHSLNHRITNVAQLMGTSLYGLGSMGAASALTTGTIGLSNEKESAITMIAGLLNSNGRFSSNGTKFNAPGNFLASLNYSTGFYPKIREEAAKYGVLNTADLTEMYMSGAPQLMHNGIKPTQALRMVDVIGSLGKVMGLASTDVQSDIRDLATGQVTTRSHVLRAIGFDAQKLRQAGAQGPEGLQKYFDKTIAGFEPALERMQGLGQSKIAKFVNQLQKDGQMIGDVLAEKLLPYLDKFRVKLEQWTSDGTLDRFAKGFGSFMEFMADAGVKLVSWAGPFFADLNRVLITGGFILVGKTLLAELIALNGGIGTVVKAIAMYDIGAGLGVLVAGLAKLRTAVIATVAIAQAGNLSTWQVLGAAIAAGAQGVVRLVANLTLMTVSMGAAALAIAGLLIWVNKLKSDAADQQNKAQQFADQGGSTKEAQDRAVNRTRTAITKGDLNALRRGFDISSETQRMVDQFTGFKDENVGGWRNGMSLDVAQWESEYGQKLKSYMDTNDGSTISKPELMKYVPNVMTFMAKKGLPISGTDEQIMGSFLNSKKITDAERKSVLSGTTDFDMKQDANKQLISAMQGGEMQNVINRLDNALKHMETQLKSFADSAFRGGVSLKAQAITTITGAQIAKEQTAFRLAEQQATNKMATAASPEEQMQGLNELRTAYTNHLGAIQALKDAYYDQLRALRDSILAQRDETASRKENLRLMGLQNAEEESKRQLGRLNASATGDFQGYYGALSRYYGASIRTIDGKSAATLSGIGREEAGVIRKGDSDAQVMSFFNGINAPGFKSMKISQESIAQWQNVMKLGVNALSISIKEASDVATDAQKTQTKTADTNLQSAQAISSAAQTNYSAVQLLLQVQQEMSAMQSQVQQSGNALSGFIAPISGGSGRQKVMSYAPLVNAMAPKFGLKSTTVMGLMASESNGNPYSVMHNPNGTFDFGLMQLNGDTLLSMHKRGIIKLDASSIAEIKAKGNARIDKARDEGPINRDALIYDPATNISWGMAELSQAIKDANGSEFGGIWRYKGMSAQGKINANQARKIIGEYGGTLSEGLTTNPYAMTKNASVPSISVSTNQYGNDPSILKGLQDFAKAQGFVVTSTNGGKHNKGSLHYLGRAIDVRTRGRSDADIAKLMEAAKAAGYRVVDERTRPKGQAVWGGPHLHIELPKGVNLPRSFGAGVDVERLKQLGLERYQEAFNHYAEVSSRQDELRQQIAQTVDEQRQILLAATEAGQARSLGSTLIGPEGRNFAGYEQSLIFQRASFMGGFGAYQFGKKPSYGLLMERARQAEINRQEAVAILGSNEPSALRDYRLSSVFSGQLSMDKNSSLVNGRFMPTNEKLAKEVKDAIEGRIKGGMNYDQAYRSLWLMPDGAPGMPGSKLSSNVRTWAERVMGTDDQNKSYMKEKITQWGQDFNKYTKEALSEQGVFDARLKFMQYAGDRFANSYRDASQIDQLVMDREVGRMGMAGMDLRLQRMVDTNAIQLSKLQISLDTERTKIMGQAQTDLDERVTKGVFEAQSTLSQAKAGNPLAYTELYGRTQQSVSQSVRQFVHENLPGQENDIMAKFNKVDLSDQDSVRSFMTDLTDKYMGEKGQAFSKYATDKTKPYMEFNKITEMMRQTNQLQEGWKATNFEQGMAKYNIDQERQLAILTGDRGQLAISLGLDPYNESLQNFAQRRSEIPGQIEQNIKGQQIKDEQDRNMLLMMKNFGLIDTEGQATLDMLATRGPEYYSQLQRSQTENAIKGLDAERLNYLRTQGPAGLARNARFASAQNFAMALASNPVGFFADFGRNLQSAASPLTSLFEQNQSSGFMNLVAAFTNSTGKLAGMPAMSSFFPTDPTAIALAQKMGTYGKWGAIRNFGYNFLGNLGGNLLGGMVGNAIFPGRSSESIGIGSSLGTMFGGSLAAAGTGIFGSMGLFGLGAAAGPVGMVLGGMLGGMLGGLFGGGKADPEKERRKQLEDQRQDRLIEVLSRLDKSLRPLPDYMRTIRGDVLYGSSSRWYSGRAYNELGLQTSAGGR